MLDENDKKKIFWVEVAKVIIGAIIAIGALIAGNEQAQNNKLVQKQTEVIQAMGGVGGPGLPPANRPYHNPQTPR